MGDRFSLDRRDYPRTWLLLDMVSQDEPVLGQEVVDLSPGAIELRNVAEQLRGYAEEREHWLAVDERRRWPRLEDRHRHELSFGPEVRYCVEHDAGGEIHRGDPFRHLAVRFSRRRLSPATSAEIALYFYGRRPAVFGFVEPGQTHGFIGMDWKPLSREDVGWLLQREVRGEG